MPSGLAKLVLIAMLVAASVAVAPAAAVGAPTFVTKWGSSGSNAGQFTDPHGIAVDSLGNGYVVDSGNNRVQKFNANGTFATQLAAVTRRLATVWNRPTGRSKPFSGGGNQWWSKGSSTI